MGNVLVARLREKDLIEAIVISAGSSVQAIYHWASWPSDSSDSQVSGRTLIDDSVFPAVVQAETPIAIPDPFDEERVVEIGSACSWLGVFTDQLQVTALAPWPK